MTKSLSSAFIVLLFFLAAPAVAKDAGAMPYVVLGKNLTQLRADFNANAGKVRLLYIVGPTCGICLRGLSDMQEALYSKSGDNPRIVTFVVHVPTLGARESNVAPASQLISNRYTTNYWEETGIIGRRIQQTMNFPLYTWDFWSVYDPRTVWSDPNKIPAPAFYMHQLDGLPPTLKLDASVLAAKANELLQRSSHASNTSKTAIR